MAKKDIGTHLVRAMMLIPYAMCFGDRRIEEISHDLRIPPEEFDHYIDLLSRCDINDFQTTIFSDSTGKLEIDIEDGELALYEIYDFDVPLRLTLAEASALYTNLLSLSTVYDNERIHSVASKLEQYMNGRYGIQMSSSIPKHNQHIMASIFEALEKKKEVSFLYESHTRVHTHTISIIRIFHYAGRAYICGWDRKLGNHRFYRLDKIHGFVSLCDTPSVAEKYPIKYDPKDPFQLHKLKIHAEFTILARNSWVLGPHKILDRYDSPEGEVLHISIPCASEEWIARFALAYSEFITPVGPEKILHSIQKQAKNALTGYILS